MDIPSSVEAYDEGGKTGNLLPSYWLAAHIICHLAPDHGIAVDIACGNGLLTLELEQSLPEIRFFGVELSPTMLSQAALNMKRVLKTLPLPYQLLFSKQVNFLRGNMEDLRQIPSQSSDLTLFTYALHHTDSEEQALAILSEIRRITKKDGALFIMDLIRPRNGTFYQFYATAFGTKNRFLQQDFEASLQAAYRPNEFQQLFERVGFKNMTYRRDLLLQMAFRPHVKAHPKTPLFLNAESSSLKAK